MNTDDFKKRSLLLSQIDMALRKGRSVKRIIESLVTFEGLTQDEAKQLVREAREA